MTFRWSTHSDNRAVLSAENVDILPSFMYSKVGHHVGKLGQLLNYFLVKQVILLWRKFAMVFDPVSGPCASKKENLVFKIKKLLCPSSGS
jgi:hypothetical protein